MQLGVRGSQGSADAGTEGKPTCIFEELGRKQATLSWKAGHTPARPPGPHGQLSEGAPCHLDHPLCSGHKRPFPAALLTPWWPWPGPSLLSVRSVLCCLCGACCLALPRDEAPTSVHFISSCSCPSWCRAMCFCHHSAPRRFCNYSVRFCLRLHFLTSLKAPALMVTSSSMVSQNVDLLA